MRKYLKVFVLIILLIMPLIVASCKKSDFKLTTDFSVIETQVNEVIDIDSLYTISNKNAKISVNVENDSILSLSENKITCKSSGESYITITAKLKDKVKEVKILIKVKAIDVYATEIVCDDMFYINLNEEYNSNVNFSVLPNNFNKDVLIDSSNTSVCDFDKINSKLIVKSAGECNLIISAQFDANTYIEKVVKIIIDNNIYPESISLLNGKNSFDVFVGYEGKINYILDKENVTKKPIFTTNSNLIEINENGEFKTKNSTGTAQINVRYYISYFEYEDIQICANIINKVNIANVSIFNSNNTPSVNFIVGEEFKYIMEIVFDNEYVLSNIIFPDSVEVLKVLEESKSKIKLEICFNKADFSSFCIAYNNVSFYQSIESKFEVDCGNVIDLIDYNVMFTNGDLSLQTNCENTYELFLFDETLCEDDSIAGFVEFDLKNNGKSLSDFIDIYAMNQDVLSVSGLTIVANGEGESKVLVYLFGILILEFDFVVKEIKANEIIIGEYNKVVYLGEEFELDVCLDISFAYNNLIFIEEVDTDCFEINGNKIKAVKYCDEDVVLKIYCGKLIEFVTLKVKYLPDSIICFNYEDFNEIENEVYITNKNGIYLAFEVYYQEILLSNEVIKIQYFSYNANNEKVYEESDILISKTTNKEFCDIVRIKPKKEGIQYVEFVLKSNSNVSLIIKIIVQNIE